MKTVLHLFFRTMLVAFLMCGFSLSTNAKNTRTTYTYSVKRTTEAGKASVCPAKGNVIASVLGVANIEGALSDQSVKFYAVQGTTGKFYGSSTLSPYGHYFNASGNAVAAAKGVLSSQFTNSNSFTINVMDGMVQDGEQYRISQAFINVTTQDTLVFVFNISIGAAEYVVGDMPEVVHRPDVTDAWPFNPMMQRNEQGELKQNWLQVNAGESVTFGLRTRNEGDHLTFSVKNPAGKQIRNTKAEDFTLTATEVADAGQYTLTAYYTPEGGTRKTYSLPFYLDVQTRQGEYFDWDADGPQWSYDFRDEYPDGFAKPEKVHTFKKKDGTAANRVDGEWWSVYWGDNLNSECGDAATVQKAAENMVKKYDTDFAYIRNEMGWPPDINARQGWKSFIYIFGSGLSNDNESNTTKGGYQSQTRADGRSWPCVWASYYPFSRFRDDADQRWSDGDYQREAMIHEGIHALFADYPGCKQSAWFQEAGNVWLQGAMSAKRGEGAQVSGWLGVGNLICPFMPIECYSGWLQDGSFGGPAAEGVNMYNGGQQICTWRNLIGGVQYGETFPIFLGLNVGYGSVPWIWRYCTDYVLKGIAQGNAAEGVAGIGDEGMRQLILHYRAKLATMDFKESSNGMRDLLNGSFGTVVKPEWEPYWINVPPFTLTPYQEISLNDMDGWYAPDTITNPGWSGGNIIPIHVDIPSGGCEVIFRPEDTQMRAQLCYRTKDGRAFYSQPVRCGSMILKWDSSNAPANGIVFAVPCNTDYIYTGDAQRKHHWDYRLKLGKGAVGPASIRKKWYFYEQTITDEEFLTGIEDITNNPADKQTGTLRFNLLTTVMHGNGQVQIDLNGIPGKEVTAHLVGASGILIDEQKVSETGTVQLPSFLPKGLYFLSLQHNGMIQTFKLFAE